LLALSNAVDSQDSPNQFAFIFCDKKMKPQRTVNMKPLKEYAANLSINSVLREVILQEEDQLGAAQFVDRLPLYLRLILRKKL
jgi:hypothetical protein